MCVTLSLDHIYTMAPSYGARQTWKILTKYECSRTEPLRKITFKRLHDPTNEIYKNLKILRFSDSMCMQNCLFMNWRKIEEKEQTAKSFSKLKYCRDNHNHQTRSAIRKLLDTPCFITNFYDTQSAKYHFIIDWNNFKNDSPR